MRKSNNMKWGFSEDNLSKNQVKKKQPVSIGNIEFQNNSVVVAEQDPGHLQT